MRYHRLIVGQLLDDELEFGPSGWHPGTAQPRLLLLPAPVGRGSLCFIRLLMWHPRLDRQGLGKRKREKRPPVDCLGWEVRIGLLPRSAQL